MNTICQCCRDFLILAMQDAFIEMEPLDVVYLGGEEGKHDSAGFVEIS